MCGRGFLQLATDRRMSTKSEELFRVIIKLFLETPGIFLTS